MMFFLLKSISFLFILSSDVEFGVGALTIISKHESGLSKTYFVNDLQHDLPADKCNLNEVIGNDIISQKKDKLKLFHLDQVMIKIRSTFLPLGYPEKIPPGYLRFSIWSWVQDLTTQLRGIIATQRVLEGVGVGREGATALSASLNFIVRDGCGMASSLFFTAATSSKFRADVKRWRMFADVVNDIGITLEVAGTLVPNILFLPMICAGNICKAMCGVAAGACGSAINLYWSSGTDISDINAKFGAQHTVTGSLGLIFAAIFARSSSTLPSSVLWTIYIVLTILHIFANMQCMKLIEFDYLNTCRSSIVASQFFTDKEIGSPGSISRTESLYFLPQRRLKTMLYKIRMGVSFDKVAKTKGVKILVDTLIRNRYALSLGNNTLNGKKRFIFVLLCSNATGEDKIRAYLHALLLEKNFSKKNIKKRGKLLVLQDEAVIIEAVEKYTAQQMEIMWPDFEKKASISGWNLSKTELQTEGCNIMLE